ncbi:MAG: glutamine synthetase [Alphaproteobacteria bacterium]|nr:glutamine synthetase family protein [Alphaproteobacteria bacterium]MDE2336202.1 glutamine synthetase [Alphaproteobacteria bacterium]
MDKLEEFIREHEITEVECLVPDMSGIARGKIIPAEKLLRILRERGMPLPESVFVQTVTGDYPSGDYISPSLGDVYITPDNNTVRLVPWYQEPTAQIICDAYYGDDTPVTISSRHLLKKILAEYESRGWRPVVAPELEFYLVSVNTDPDIPLQPPIGRSGRKESGRQAYGIDAVNEFDPIFEDVYDYCEEQNIDIDTLSHEAGAAQIEVNFNHGDPLEVADQAFLFKRTAREVAMRHGVYATFMAQPMQLEPGSAMHIHQSVVDARSGRNLFSTEDGQDTKFFRNYIGGMQKYLPAALPLMAPNVNSFRRFGHKETDSPINVEWGLDNRTAGLRVPVAKPENRRVENRLPGADGNPYLTITATLACGLLGLLEEIEPTEQVKGSAYKKGSSLPMHMTDSLKKFKGCKPLSELLGEQFVRTLVGIKETEFKAYNAVISSWERESLLLNV